MATPTSNGVVTFLTTSNYSGTTYIDTLAIGTKWAGGIGSNANLTFSIASWDSYFSTDSYTGYGPVSGSGEPWNGGSPLTATQATAARNALSTWADVANITFNEVTDSYSVAGDIRFARSDAPSTAWAYYPNATANAGDIWFSKSSQYDTATKGTYGYTTFIHEIGHALGLKHPHDPNVGGQQVAPSSNETTLQSVMSYRSYEGQSLYGGYTQDYYAYTPMLHDIAAIQYLYGANTTTRAGNTTYNWSTGQQIF